MYRGVVCWMLVSVILLSDPSISCSLSPLVCETGQQKFVDVEYQQCGRLGTIKKRLFSCLGFNYVMDGITVAKSQK